LSSCLFQNVSIAVQSRDHPQPLARTHLSRSFFSNFITFNNYSTNESQTLLRYLHNSTMERCKGAQIKKQYSEIAAAVSAG